MPPATRIPTLRFRSLLSSPVRLPLRVLQPLHRPQCAVSSPRSAPPPCLTQRRGLNLYKTARSKVLLGQHKALIFSPYILEPPSASPYLINLFEANKQHTKHTLIVRNISLEDAYNQFVKDGYMIYSMKPLVRDMAKEYMNAPDEEFPDMYKDYSFVKARTHRIPLDGGQQGHRQLGGLKNIIFNESSPVSHYRLSMDRAYQFIDNGSPVEVRIRLQGKVPKMERHKPGDPTIWPWMHAHFPHLRPDFILKGMPEGTKFIINPVSDGRICQWVMAKEGDFFMPDLNARFDKIKTQVMDSIKTGRQEMLPKLMREQLREAGVLDYSPHTGLPKLKARKKYAKGGKVTYGAEEKKRFEKDAEGAGFLQPDPKYAQKAEEDKARRRQDDWERTVDEAEEKYGKKPRHPVASWMGRGSRR